MTNSFRNATFHTSAFELSQLIPDHGYEIAFAGRSNAGKSSAINCLTDQKGLCKTSKTPGRTQLINFFRLDDERHLVDLPGYGFAKVPKKLRQHWDTVLSTYLLHRNALKGLVIVVDIRRGISELDEALIEMLNNSLPLHVLLTKADKLSRAAAASAVLAVEKQIDRDLHSASSLSVINRKGLQDLETRCRQWLKFY
jgi:GTP-binding protein